ncbi:MAG: molybdopterin-dependent oxidoreductase [Novosphingobium sp.]|nr:molybdopterin-dependent oxidoreductase [Novosphingobium sp.]MCP5404165.1 molybdopterin-dependent oxidoreductase [Novosphingobium sp.]
MATRQARSFCRICAAHCGVVLTIENETDRIVAVKGDKQNPMSRGYVCFKGLQAEEAHHGPARLLRPLKRQPDGSFAEIESEQALDEISDRLRGIVERCGPEAVGTFKGTSGSLYSTHMIQLDFLSALGSNQFYSVNTIDQSAKLVSFERQGGWGAGLHDISQSEVLLFFGCNPVISHSTMPVMGPDPLRTLKQAKERGLKLICIDPRRSETAYFADLHLQPLPGRDTAIAGAMVRTILDEGWENKEFVARHVGADRIADLRKAVDRFTPDFAERVAGLEPGQIRAAAKMFAKDSASGAAFAATGPSMSPFSNTMQHLVDSLNIICGRFRQAGQKAVVDMINPADPIRAEVIPPPRSWNNHPPSRIRGVGMLGYDRLASTLAEEILTPGKGQIRAMFVSGSNPATCLPDQKKAVEAFRDLELLVVMDPYLSTTAKLAHYVLPPTMMYERPDLPIAVPGSNIGTISWSQYAPPVIDPPEGADLVEDWYPYWAIAKRLGLDMKFSGFDLDFGVNQPPSTDDMLEMRAAHGRITLAELKADLRQYPSGRIYDHPSAMVQPARPEANGRFDVMPEDVAAEIEEFLASDLAQAPGPGPGHSHLLISRRMNRVMNSVGNNLEGTLKYDPVNPAYMNPAEFDALGIAPGDRVEIASDHGTIETVAQPDEAVRPGVVSISHCWGGLPDEDGPGVNTNLLIADDRDLASVNMMPRMSAVPVNVSRAG